MGQGLRGVGQVGCQASISEGSGGGVPRIFFQSRFRMGEFFLQHESSTRVIRSRIMTNSDTFLALGGYWQDLR